MISCNPIFLDVFSTLDIKKFRKHIDLACQTGCSFHRKCQAESKWMFGNILFDVSSMRFRIFCLNYATIVPQ